ncbi:MAG: septum formation initiator family protein [Bacteroidetes bacterium]|nr:MAG: septum formation initiator family protein [Bacteroidota bacterium]
MKKLISILTNKYLLVLLIAGGWLMFFDPYNFMAQRKVSEQIETFKRDKAFYEAEIEALDYERDRLYNDAEELERYAREKYKMKKKGEDVFVIVKETD